MMAISIDLESVRFTRPGGRPRGSLAEHDARKPRFFRKRFLEKHIPRLGIYRLAGFVDFKRLPDRSLQVLTGCRTQDAILRAPLRPELPAQVQVRWAELSACGNLRSN